MLLTRDIKPSTQIQVINDFQKHFVDTQAFSLPESFKDAVLRINQNEPTAAFATEYLEASAKFLGEARVYREATDKEVVEK